MNDHIEVALRAISCYTNHTHPAPADLALLRSMSPPAMSELPDNELVCALILEWLARRKSVGRETRAAPDKAISA